MSIREEVKNIISESLDSAERKWKKSGSELITKAAVSNEAITEDRLVPSFIPGHPMVEDGEALVRTFIALMVDMCESSKHLNCHIANAKITQLQRIFYETSVLLPVIGTSVAHFDGSVTEYLGDGALAFFQVDENDKSESVRKAFKASKFILDVALPMINEELSQRYDLPPLKLSLGMGMSKALLTVIGNGDYLHAKAFGECVFRAAKSSNLENTIKVDDNIRASWPKGKNGKVTFDGGVHKSGFKYFKVSY